MLIQILLFNVQIRSGFFKEGIDKLELTKGEQITLTSDYNYKGDKHKLACSYDALATSVQPGQHILVADGSLVLTVLSCDEPAGEVLCRIENNAAIGERKNMNLPGVVVDLPTFTEKGEQVPKVAMEWHCCLSFYFLILTFAFYSTI